MNFLINIMTSVIASIIFWAGLGAVFAGYVKTTQAHIRKFFGLKSEHKLIIYLSNVWSPDTVLRSESSRPVYYIGLSELKASQALTGLFGTTSFRLPDMVRGFVDSIWSNSTKNVETIIGEPIGCDSSRGHLNGTESLVIIGSSLWNSLRRSYIEKQPVAMLFSFESSPESQMHADTVIIQRGPAASEIVKPNLKLGILERVQDPATRSVVFFCIGASGTTSRAVTEYLVKNWRHLQKEFGNTNFAVCLGFANAEDHLDANAEDHLDAYVEPVRLGSYNG